jgi:hypothetical protein
MEEVNHFLFFLAGGGGYCDVPFVKDDINNKVTQCGTVQRSLGDMQLQQHK